MKALVLAGGFPQIELINNLHSRNIEVILADYNDEPVAKKYADRFFKISTLDVNAIRKLVITESVDFLITVCTDQALHTVAKVSEELRLPCYIDYQTALNVTNKEYMKSVFAAHNIPTAKHIVLREYNDGLVESMCFPLVVKPVDCNSSKGVRRCKDLEELRLYFSEAVKYSRSHTAVVEEYIDGREISVDVYVEDGKAHILCISNSDKIPDSDRFIIFRALYPAMIDQTIVSQIEDVAQKITDAFNIVNSPMLIQILSDGKNIYVVEFSARTGGGVKYLLIKRTSGFDVIDAVVELTIGGKPHVIKKRKEYKYLINDFIYCYSGVFDHLDGFDELMKEGIITDYYLFKWKGAEFRDIRASGDRIAGYTVTGENPHEIIEKQKEANRRIKAISTTGDDMIRHDLLVPLIDENGFLKSD